MTILNEELRGARERRWNSERTPKGGWTTGQTASSAPFVEDTCGAGKTRGACTGAISEREREESAAMAHRTEK